MKRTRLRRFTPLRASKRLNPISSTRRAEATARAEVREAVFDRDRWRCRLADWPDRVGRCMGDLTFHHLRKASAGGAYTVENGVALCAYHNGLMEDRPDLAVAFGMVIR